MKKSMIALLTGASLLASAGVACADGTLTMYGSTAQAKYWAAQAQTWLQSMGCSAPTAAVSATTGSATHYSVSGTGCSAADATAVAGSGTLTVLYTGLDSVSGVQSVRGTIASPDGCSAANQRIMYPGGTSTANCQTVDMGIADVKASSLNQKSMGHKMGPMDSTGVVITNDFTTAAGIASTTDAGLTVLNKNATVATPFGFWVNNAVTAKTCTAGLSGNYCAANADCNSTAKATDGVCGSAATITNVTRLEASLIFSGQVANWSDLGGYFANLPVTVCLRHAGSGTHATLVNAVMDAGGTNWGTSVLTYEDGVSGDTPQVWFNYASSDEMACINGQSVPINNALAGDDPVANGDQGANSTTVATGTTGAAIGAIGYSDADATASNNVSLVRYNGFFPTRFNLRNGIYDFYAIAWYYTNPANSAAINKLAADAVTYAANPANMVASKANYWATAAEMHYVKASDQAYPGYVTASKPQTP